MKVVKEIRRWSLWWGLCFSALLLLVDSSPAQKFDPPKKGVVIVSGGRTPPEAVWGEFRQQIERSELGKRLGVKVAIIPTGDPEFNIEEELVLRRVWLARGNTEISILHAPKREDANSPAILESLRNCSGVWIGGGKQELISERYVGTAVEIELVAFLNRGGVLAGNSAGAAVMSRVMIKKSKEGQKDEPEVGIGFPFLNNLIVDQHFSERNRQERLQRMLEQHPGYFGIGVDERTAAVLFLGESEVCGYAVGESNATLFLPAGTKEKSRLFCLPKDSRPITIAPLAKGE